MSTARRGAKDGHGLTAVALPAPPGWWAYLIPLKSLPLERGRRGEMLAAVQGLVAAVRRGASTERSVWLQMDELHRDNAIREISQHARRWSPEIGLGMRPEAPPPRYWTNADLMDRDYDSAAPVLMHNAVHLETDEAGSQHACEVMTGTAGLIQVLHAAPVARVRGRWYETFQPTIREEGLAAYPVYVPLLGAASAAGSRAEDLDRWMGEADVYLRESIEDQGLFVLARHALDAAMEEAELYPVALRVN